MRKTCDVCPKSFNTEAALRMHKLRVHTPNYNKPKPKPLPELPNIIDLSTKLAHVLLDFELGRTHLHSLEIQALDKLSEMIDSAKASSAKEQLEFENRKRIGQPPENESYSTGKIA